MQKESLGWSSLKEQAVVTYEQWYDRVYHGMHPVEAATRPINKQVKMYTIDGVRTTTKQHCDARGLNLNTVKYRMKKHGMTFPEAIRYPTDTSMSRK